MRGCRACPTGTGFRQTIMNWIGRLFNELRRRRVFRMTAVYIITSWVVLQVADLLFPALGIDETALRCVKPTTRFC